MLHCYNFAILPPQSLEGHTNKYRSLAERTQSYNLIIDTHRVQRVQNLFFLLSIAHRLMCIQKPYFSSLFLPSFPLTSHLFHPFPARGPNLLVYFVAKVFCCLFFVLFSSAIVDYQDLHKGAPTQLIKLS